MVMEVDTRGATTEHLIEEVLRPDLARDDVSMLAICLTMSDGDNSRTL